MNTLTINPKKFDKQVWQTETDFTTKQYNEWLQGTAKKLLEAIYDSDDIADAMTEEGLDIYILGDIINMISNTKIKIEK